MRPRHRRVHLLPDRVRDAVEYAESRTATTTGFTLNIALAYGGRAELLGAARDVAAAVENETLARRRLCGRRRAAVRKPVRDVDLIIRPGGDERTSNFLPWHANGNEAAVYFCAPYWPEFSKVDFLRGIRTYESREQSWQRTRPSGRRHWFVPSTNRSYRRPSGLGRFRGALPRPNASNARVYDSRTDSSGQTAAGGPDSPATPAGSPAS